MAKASPTADSPLLRQLHALTSREPADHPIVSLYLSLTPNQRGRDDYDVFCRRAFADQLKAFEGRPERAGLAAAFARIEAYLADEVNRSANGLALFASSAPDDDFFEAIQLDAPIDDHWLFIGAVPHVSPLARLVDQYPRYAAVLIDTNFARVIVFALGAVESRAQVEGEKTRRHSMGGWSQARYQRHIDNIHLHHMKEVVDTLERIVRDENVEHVILAGNDVAVPLLRQHLPEPLAAKVVDVLRLDRRSGEAEIVDEALDALRRHDAETDAERVAEVLGAWRGGGLGVAGPEATLRALQLGQVDELLIAGDPQHLKTVQRLPDDAAPPPQAAETSAAEAAERPQLHLSDELVIRAAQTGARVRIIEDPALLADHGGVAAALRFRV
jgi:peptide chain release factor subunit 1